LRISGGAKKGSYRGEHFLDDDVTRDDEYEKAIMRLYNSETAQEYRDKYAPDIHKRKTTKEISRIIRMPVKPREVSEKPKKIMKLGWFGDYVCEAGLATMYVTEVIGHWYGHGLLVV
jgi:hypothetical protein